MVRQPRITTAIAAALAIAASLASTASADPAPLAQAEAAIAASHGSTSVQPNPDEETVPAGRSSGPCSEVCSGAAGSYVAVPAAPSRAVVRVVGHSAAFSWRDAAIGAGTTLLFLGIGLAGTRAATLSRRRRGREQHVIAAS